MRIWYVSSECAPFSKSGGLADVAYSLPPVLKSIGDDVEIGSHVIIHSDHPSPEALAAALRLAAWYSRGKGVSVPVDYTLRKHVKKPGGSPAGFVIYTNQHTLYVKPAEETTPV